MNRRRFLSSTMIGGLGLAGFAKQASAFTEETCSAYPGTAACAEILRHKTLLAELDHILASKGVPPAERKVLLAKAICPFCGQPLIG